ncbi:MAG TPA: gephyrin-like molybdotransferase Glp [Bryobacteraceae bacterium]|nr:gephyrin-like molybdotransferase Glp [Bryobacteraceae bacterium]
MTALHWGEARDCVRRKLGESLVVRASETIPLGEAQGRVLASDAHADRAYPPFARSMRDGFAVRAADVPGRLRLVGEVRAGEPAERAVSPGECIEIMTGAPTPEGADAILMVEHVRRQNGFIETDRSLKSGDNIAPAGCETGAGERVLSAGTRLDYAHLAVLASIGAAQIDVYKRPTVSLIATGDVLVAPHEGPKPYQIRNSNAVSLAAQAARAGGAVAFATQAGDSVEALRSAITRGLESDLMLLSGGVSAGKYDLVENVLAEYDAEFFFTRVLIQPGQPAVFGRARDKFFFGLPGNPVSTMVTFELFARLAVEILAGQSDPVLRFTKAVLTTPFRHKTGLTRFLPASLSGDASAVTPVGWQGSGDVFAVARANAFLVAAHDRESWNAGEAIEVLPR